MVFRGEAMCFRLQLLLAEKQLVLQVIAQPYSSKAIPLVVHYHLTLSLQSSRPSQPTLAMGQPKFAEQHLQECVMSFVTVSLCVTAMHVL